MSEALISKLLKNSTIKETAILSKSKIFKEKDFTLTAIPMINVALSGQIDGGLEAGSLMLAGPSRHFKTAFALFMATSYLKQYDDAVILFYDSEFGTPLSYIDSFGINKERVVHSPIMDIEQLKFDIVQQLQSIEKTDRILILIDSLGNLASKKEIEDALDQKSVADMTRAKQMKSLWRMITPYLTMKNIPLVAINHTYKEIALYPKDIVSGGTGGVYSANDIWIIGRQQDKDKKTGEMNGYDFIINIEKSRRVKEKSKIPISVTFEGGISKWSGLLECALEAGYVIKPKNGWYQIHNVDTGVTEEKLYREDFLKKDGATWKRLFTETKFPEWLKGKYQLSHAQMVQDDETATVDIEEEDNE